MVDEDPKYALAVRLHLTIHAPDDVYRRIDAPDSGYQEQVADLQRQGLSPRAAGFYIALGSKEVAPETREEGRRRLLERR